MRIKTPTHPPKNEKTFEMTIQNLCRGLRHVKMKFNAMNSYVSAEY